MSWLKDANAGPKDEAREALLVKREALVVKIEALKKAPVGKSNAAIQGRQEDLVKLARDVITIDRKLGRSHE